jgi:hypothetical protein
MSDRTKILGANFLFVWIIGALALGNQYRFMPFYVVAVILSEIAFVFSFCFDPRFRIENRY